MKIYFILYTRGVRAPVYTSRRLIHIIIIIIVSYCATRLYELELCRPVRIEDENTAAAAAAEAEKTLRTHDAEFSRCSSPGNYRETNASARVTLIFQQTEIAAHAAALQVIGQ